MKKSNRRIIPRQKDIKYKTAQDLIKTINEIVEVENITADKIYIEYDYHDSYGSTMVDVYLEYSTLETDDEYDKRILKEKEYEGVHEQKERQQLALLMKKYKV